VCIPIPLTSPTIIYADTHTRGVWVCGEKQALAKGRHTHNFKDREAAFYADSTQRRSSTLYLLQYVLGNPVAVNSWLYPFMNRPGPCAASGNGKNTSREGIGGQDGRARVDGYECIRWDVSFAVV